MAVMRWTEKMSVGVPELDADHKELIKVINQLRENSAAAARGTAVRQCLFALLRYAEYHFAREEKVLATCHYPKIREHNLEHRDFVARVNEMHRRFDDNPDDPEAVVNDELLGFLRDWLNHHILIEDAAYRAHAERSPVAREAARSFKATEVWWSRRPERRPRQIAAPPRPPLPRFLSETLTQAAPQWRPCPRSLA